MQWIDVGEKFWWCQYWLFTSVHLFQIIQDILKWTLPKEKSIQNIFSEKFLQRKRTNWTWEYGNQNPFNKFLNRPEFSLFCFAQPLPCPSPVPHYWKIYLFFRLVNSKLAPTLTIWPRCLLPNPTRSKGRFFMIIMINIHYWLVW